MLLEGSSDIVRHIERSVINAQQIEILHLSNSTVLVIGEKSLALYKDSRSISDPLGNGLIQLVNIENFSFDIDHPVVLEHRAGYVGLAREQVLLILPNAVKLFRSKSDALQGANSICTLPLE
ncbi:hypothetical protein TDB9533_02595 [Thalassocella blandensis]|nr:hypothetical protein TDB9533_02595 [Thalassocella blandensis]